SCWWPCPSCGPVRPWRKEMVEKNLPPLPDSCMITYEFPDGAYDSESMTAYGRACYEAAISAHRVDDDTYTDENGTVWTRPTAWAYAQACKARDKWQAKAAQKADDARDSLRYALETMVEMVEMSGFGRAYAMNVARAALAQQRKGE